METVETQKIDDQSVFIDTTRIVCLLCKRRFESIDNLKKHLAKSELHKVILNFECDQ